MMDTGKPVVIRDEIDYINGGIASKQLLECKEGNITLFAFDKGQGLTEHTSPFNALVQVIEGAAEISIGGNLNSVSEGESILLPADIPHALTATENFKMILTMIKCNA
ncbi:cupin domain-containing protein [Bacteroidota bacterium]